MPPPPSPRLIGVQSLHQAQPTGGALRAGVLLRATEREGASGAPRAPRHRGLQACGDPERHARCAPSLPPTPCLPHAHLYIPLTSLALSAYTQGRRTRAMHSNTWTDTGPWLASDSSSRTRRGPSSSSSKPRPLRERLANAALRSFHSVLVRGVVAFFFCARWMLYCFCACVSELGSRSRIFVPRSRDFIIIFYSKVLLGSRVFWRPRPTS